MGYVGDADGDARLTTLDVQRVARIVSGADSGFSAWPEVSALLVADFNADGKFTAIDPSYLLQKVRGLARPEIPDIPLDITINLGGPDPLVDIPRDLTAQVGDIITVPVRLDNTDGLEGVELLLGYDPAVLELLQVRRGSATADFDFYVQEQSAGSVRIDTARMNPLEAGSGNLLELDLRIKAAPAEGSVIDLQSVRLNAGRLTLTFEPHLGDDPTDGYIALSARLDAPVAATPERQREQTQQLAWFAARSEGARATGVDWSAAYPDFALRPRAPEADARPLPDWKQATWARDLAARLGERAAGDTTAAPDSSSGDSGSDSGGERVAAGLLKRALRLAPRLWS